MILTINGGSSSIKFSLFTTSLEQKIKGKIDRIGLAGPHLTYTDLSTGKENIRRPGCLQSGDSRQFIHRLAGKIQRV